MREILGTRFGSKCAQVEVGERVRFRSLRLEVCEDEHGVWVSFTYSVQQDQQKYSRVDQGTVHCIIVVKEIFGKWAY